MTTEEFRHQVRVNGILLTLIAAAVVLAVCGEWLAVAVVVWWGVVILGVEFVWEFRRWLAERREP